MDPVNGMVFTDPTWSIDQRNSNPNLPTGASLLNDEIQQRQAGEKATSDANAATAAQTAATNEQNFQGSRQTAYDQAMNAIGRTFQLQGQDPNAYWASDIKPALDRAYSSVPGPESKSWLCILSNDGN